MLRLDHVGVTLGGRRVVDDVSLDIADGSWTCLLGPNGAGKSSTLRSVAGLLPHDGSIVAAGVNLGRARARQRARAVAFVPQSPIVPADMSTLDYVLLGRTPHIPTFGVESPHDREVAHTLLSSLDLDGFAIRPLGSLSGGEMQRAVLARALAQEAPVLLLDEPTTALDVGHQQQVLELVARLLCERRLTVLAALHDLTLAAQYADRVVMMSGGQIVADGRPGDVLTADTVATVYGADVKVIDVDGAPVVIPIRRFV